MITPNAPGRSPTPSNQEVLEVKNDHIEDATAVCLCVMDMGKLGIEDKLFEEDSLKLALLEGMIAETQNTL